MKNFFEKIWKHLAVFTVGVFIGLMINLPSCNKLEPTIIKVPVHDTIKVDSIRIEQHTKPIYLNRIDTFYITEKQDTVYVDNLPIEYKEYNDTIKTDSTSTEIKIQYHGFNSDIDGINLVHNYYNTTKIIPEEKKKISPFISFSAGPNLDASFKEINGAAIELGAGAIFKNGWGIQANYEINANVNEASHTIKLGAIKKW